MNTKTPAIQLGNLQAEHRLRAAAFARLSWVSVGMFLIAMFAYFLLLSQSAFGTRDPLESLKWFTIVTSIITVVALPWFIVKSRQSWQSFRLRLFDQAILRTQDGQTEIVLPTSEVHAVRRYPGGGYWIQGVRGGQQLIDIPPGIEDAAKFEQDLTHLLGGMEIQRFSFGWIWRVLAVLAAVWFLVSSNPYPAFLLTPWVLFELLRSAMNCYRSPSPQDEMHAEWIGYAVLAFLVGLKAVVVVFGALTGSG